MSDLEEAFELWKTLAELQVEFVEVLGEHKLNAAKSELVRAVAAERWTVARMKATVARELEACLKRLSQHRHRTNQQTRRLARQAKDAAKIRSGEDIPASQLSMMWAAYTVFERLTPVSVLEEITGTPLHPGASEGREYADPGQPDRVCPGPPRDVQNVHALISWLRNQRLVPRRGTQAYRQVVGAFAEIASVAATEIRVLRDAIQALERETYDTWRPVVIAALPDNVDVKKILKIGT